MRVAMLGVNHKLADLELREQLSQCCQRRFATPHLWCGGLQCVLLITCNRTEIYFSANPITEAHSYILNVLRSEVPGEFDQKLYSYFGADCFNHLCRVTAGLDSAVIGETAIQGQVKNAYAATASQALLPPELHYLFQKALSISKKVRSDLPLNILAPNFGCAVYRCGSAYFKNIREARILFVGASEINQKIIAYFKQQGFTKIVICNRTLSSAEKIAALYHLEILLWDKLSRWSTFDWIIVGTKSSEHLLTRTHFPCHSKLIIDLSVPRNVDSKIGVPLFNIDQIHANFSLDQAPLTCLLSKAENQISMSIRHHLQLFHNKTEKNYISAAIA